MNHSNTAPAKVDVGAKYLLVPAAAIWLFVVAHSVWNRYEAIDRSLLDRSSQPAHGTP